MVHLEEPETIEPILLHPLDEFLKAEDVLASAAALAGLARHMTAPEHPDRRARRDRDEPGGALVGNREPRARNRQRDGSTRIGGPHLVGPGREPVPVLRHFFVECFANARQLRVEHVAQIRRLYRAPAAKEPREQLRFVGLQIRFVLRLAVQLVVGLR